MLWPAKSLLLLSRACRYNVFLTLHKRVRPPLMSDFFNDAYRRARSRFTTEQWLALTPQQVTQAIYQAMREIDAASASRMAARSQEKTAKASRKNHGGNP
jgi:hypothetical protein